MRQAQKKIVDWNEVVPSRERRSVVGRIVDITPEGAAVVDFSGNALGPLPARSVITEPLSDDVSDRIGAKVLLAFEDGEPSLPIVVGFVRNTLFSPSLKSKVLRDVERPEEAVMDGRTVRLDAKEEIALCCGQSAILLKKDGRVVIKGVEITNRAVRSNKIKGGKVQIN
jgi:hypothetical protein